MTARTRSLRDYWPLLLFIGLIAVAYGNSLQNAFVSDDVWQILENDRLGEWSFIIRQPLAVLRELVNALIFDIFGKAPWAFRLPNFLFHFGVTVMVFLIGQRLGNRTVGLVAASLTAVHPLLSEGVVWISAGTYPQYAFFFLLSLYGYLRRTNNWYWLSIFAFFLALQSNEKVIPLALTFPLADLLIVRRKLEMRDLKLDIGRRTLPYILLSAIWVFAYQPLVEGRISDLVLRHEYVPGTDDFIAKAVVAISKYLELFVFPDRLAFDHSPILLGQPEWWFRVGSVGLFLGLLVYALRRMPTVGFFLLLFPLSLAVTLTPLRFNPPVAERYVYLGAVCLILAAALLFVPYLERRLFQPVAIGLFGLVVIALLTRTAIRNLDWRTLDALAFASVQEYPGNPYTHNNLGDYYLRHGDIPAAAREFGTAIDLKPDYPDGYHNLGYTEHLLGNVEAAIGLYERAVALRPNLWQSHLNAAQLYLVRGEEGKAKAAYERARTINPAIKSFDSLRPGVVELKRETEGR